LRRLFAAPQDATSAFEQAFATSLFAFDACGDDLTGEMFRKALAAKMALCPIPEEAMKRYQQRTAFLLKKEQDRIKRSSRSAAAYPTKSRA
jgi:hypothetical protein